MKTTRRAQRRHDREAKKWRRLKEDWNQHYNDFDCPCRESGRRQGFMADTPKLCSGPCCGNRRRWPMGESPFTMQERRAFLSDMDEWT